MSIPNNVSSMIITNTYHYTYQEWECAEGTIRRLKVYPDGRLAPVETMWKWSYLKPLLEAGGFTLDAEGYDICHIDIQGHNMKIETTTELLEISIDGMDICWEK